MKPHITYDKTFNRWVCKVANHFVFGLGTTPLDSYSWWLVQMAIEDIDPWERDKK